MKNILLFILLFMSASSYAETAKCQVGNFFQTKYGPNVRYIYPKTMPLSQVNLVFNNTCMSSSGNALPVYVYLESNIIGSDSIEPIPGGAAPIYEKAFMGSDQLFTWQYFSLIINGINVPNTTQLDTPLVYTTDTKTKSFIVNNQWSLSTNDDGPKYQFFGSYHLYICPDTYKKFTTNCTTIVADYVTGDHVAPNCEINAGNAMTVDFGTLQSKAFLTAGAPVTSARKNVKIPVTCTGVSASTLEVQFVATPDATNENFAATTTDGVAVIVTDTKGTTIPVDSGKTTFPISNSKGTLEFNVTPVGTTGKAPAAGKFTSLITLYIDIP